MQLIRDIQVLGVSFDFMKGWSVSLTGKRWFDAQMCIFTYKTFSIFSGFNNVDVIFLCSNIGSLQLPLRGMSCKAWRNHKSSYSLDDYKRLCGLLLPMIHRSQQCIRVTLLLKPLALVCSWQQHRVVSFFIQVRCGIKIRHLLDVWKLVPITLALAHAKYTYTQHLHNRAVWIWFPFPAIFFSMLSQRGQRFGHLLMLEQVQSYPAHGFPIGRMVLDRKCPFPSFFCR